MQPSPDETTRVAALREALPSTAAGIGLDVMGGGPLPAETARAMAEADDWDLRTGRSGVDRRDDLAQRLEEARGVLAALLGTDPTEIVLTHGIRDAIALARSLVGTGELTVIEGVDRSTGMTRALPGGAPAVGPWLLDAGDTAGVMPFRAAETGASFVAIAGDRWLLGPEGTGALWIAPGAASNPGSAAGQERLDPLPRRSALGLARSVGWLEMYVGLPWLYARTAVIAKGLRQRLAAIDGVELMTPVDDPSAIAVFSIANWPADEAAHELSARTFAILGPPVDERRLRVSVGAWTSVEELDRFCDIVDLLAGHTPATLPRRPGLVVLASTERS